MQRASFFQIIYYLYIYKDCFIFRNMLKRKNVTLRVDENLYNNFKKYTDDKGFIISRQFENLMKAILIEEGLIDE